MGLDCTAYSNVTVLPVDPEREVDWDATVDAFAYSCFPRSTRGLVDHDRLSRGGYFIAERDYDISASKTFGWRAGSYSNYGRWRESLAAITGLPRESFDPTADGSAPFYELVWFADNEGAIGYEAAADLLADFQAYRDAYRAAHADDRHPWMTAVYDDWITGLTLAADHGLVRLH